jgi:phage tail sheath protein FI
MKAPGVYLEEIFLKPEVLLPTGVPGFVGFFKAKKDEDEVPPNSHLILHRQQEFTDKYTTLDSYLTEAVVGFFENGGTFCYVVRADPDIKVKKTALMNALKDLENLDNIDLLAVPDAMTLQPDDIYEVQKAVIKHCEEYGDRFAILDGYGDMTSVLDQREKITANQTGVNAALYYPPIKVRSSTDDDSDSLKPVPPCGHIAGIFSRSDRDRGVFKAPANEEIRDAVHLKVLIDNSDQGKLNSQGINCLRAFPGRGIRVWGARTLSDSNWRYINVRRLFITIKRWIDLNMVWATFEPNTPQLWVRIQRELSAYLTQLWRAGALKGKTSEEAFYVKCDAETNPPESRERGNVFTEIGFAPSSPTEFIFVRIVHRANTTELS